MAESQDALLLHRRARRRLVGAIALVVFIVIFLPIVLDQEPKPVSQDLSVQIPSQEAGRFNTRVLPASPIPAPKGGSVAAPDKAPPPLPLDAPKAAAGGETQAAEPSKAARPEPPSAKAAPGEPGNAERKRAEAAERERALAALADQGWVVPLGAFTNQENVKHLQAKLSAAGIKTFTDTVQGKQGPQTRVRAGPFPTKDAADQAREKLKDMGLPVGAVASR